MERFALPPVEIVAKEGWYDAAARQASDAVELHVPVRNASLSPSEADAQAIRAEIERAVLEPIALWACATAAAST